MQVKAGYWCSAGDKVDDLPAPFQHQQVLETWAGIKGSGHELMQGKSFLRETTRAQAQVAGGPSSEIIQRDF